MEDHSCGLYRIALIGDYNPVVIVHQAIPEALKSAGQHYGVMKGDLRVAGLSFARNGVIQLCSSSLITRMSIIHIALSAAFFTRYCNRPHHPALPEPSKPGMWG
jgi:hypothetical protein